MKPNPPIVEIKWVDSTAEDGWISEDEFVKKVEDDEYQTCWSAGYLVRQDNDTVTISLAVTTVDKKTGDRDFHTMLTIPRGSIKDLKIIVPPN